MPRVAGFFPRRFYNPGSYTSRTQILSPIATNFTVVAVRGTPANSDTWPVRQYNGTPRSQEVLQWLCEISYDDGATWEIIGGAGCAGGEDVNPRTGLPIPTSGGGIKWIKPERNNEPRLGRIRVEVIERIRVQFHLDWDTREAPVRSELRHNSVAHVTTVINADANTTSARRQSVS